jgi:hypothetical protein
MSTKKTKKRTHLKESEPNLTTPFVPSLALIMICETVLLLSESKTFLLNILYTCTAEKNLAPFNIYPYALVVGQQI